jgi:2-(1,2-epoxy-1,2-dihydrophenyl)acetyl-CoA isomerase
VSQYETVTIEREGPVAIVTLARPDVLNAFNSGLRSDILAAAREVNQDDSVKVVVFTGAGRAFSAGADLGEKQPEGFDVQDQLNNEFKPALMEITNAPKPWIAAVRGAAAGIGSAYALSCDLVVMSEDSYIYQAFTAISLVPDGGATWHLVHTLGRHKAYEIIATGEKLKAADCLGLGLCNRVVPTDTLLQDTVAWANELALKAPLSLRYAKQALNAAITQELGDTISNEARLQALCVGSEDAAEGIAAFQQKRSPVFKGK